MKPIRFHQENLAKHGVRPDEVRECFAKGRRRYLKKAKKGVYQLIGQSASGRYLEILYENREGETFVFHAMNARHSQVKLLQKKGKR